jgi:hypothetical protein
MMTNNVDTLKPLFSKVFFTTKYTKDAQSTQIQNIENNIFVYFVKTFVLFVVKDFGVLRKPLRHFDTP